MPRLRKQQRPCCAPWAFPLTVSTVLERRSNGSSSSAEPVDLLLTDIVMPEGMNGLDLAQEARARFPGLPILLMSGYNDTVAWPNEISFRILRKPVPFAELEAAVHEQL